MPSAGPSINDQQLQPSDFLIHEKFPDSAAQPNTKLVEEVQPSPVSTRQGESQRWFCRPYITEAMLLTTVVIVINVTFYYTDRVKKEQFRTTDFPSTQLVCREFVLCYQSGGSTCE